MPLRLRSAGGGSVTLKPPVALSTEAAIEVPAYDGAKLLTDKTPGCVLQVVSTTMNGGVSTSSTTYVDTGLQAVITPFRTTSKILVIANYAAAINSSGGNNSESGYAIERNGTSIVSVTAPRIYSYGSANYTNNSQGLSKLDSPNSVAALTYKLRFFKGNGPGLAYMSGDGGDATLTLMEIAA
jgi:hypothetical protein